MKVLVPGPSTSVVRQNSTPVSGFSTAAVRDVDSRLYVIGGIADELLVSITVVSGGMIVGEKWRFEIPFSSV